MKDSQADNTYYGIFNDSYPPIMDGVTLTVQNYVEGFIQHGKNPCVVTPWNPVAIPTSCKVMKFFSLPIWNRHPYRYGYPKLDPFIWTRLRRTPFSILHAHCPFSSGRLAVYVKRHQHVPLIGTFHSKYKSDLEHSFDKTPWMVPIIMKRILAFFNSCDEVWIPQAQVEDTVREYGYKGNLEVVPNGNDMVQQGDISLFKTQARKEIGISPNEIALLFVGQHIWEKGIGIIIDALIDLKDKIPFKMNFIGTGYAASELKRKIITAGLEDKVHLHGMIQDREVLKKYYAGSDIFLFPSYYDNAPLVMREAAAFETPTILPEGSTASEVIINGQNGFLTQRSAPAYASLINELYSNREKLKLVGRNARVSLTQSWDDVINEVLDRYSVIIKNYKL